MKLVDRKIVSKAIDEQEPDVKISDDAVDYLTNIVDGDARSALNSLQLVLESARADGRDTVTRKLDWLSSPNLHNLKLECFGHISCWEDLSFLELVACVAYNGRATPSTGKT